MLTQAELQALLEYATTQAASKPEGERTGKDMALLALLDHIDVLSKLVAEQRAALKTAQQGVGAIYQLAQARKWQSPRGAIEDTARSVLATIGQALDAPTE